MSEIRGLDRLVRKINALGGNSEKALEKGIRHATMLVQGDAKNLAPVDVGFLQNSIRAKTKVKNGVVEGKVSTNLFYAPYVEFGTGQRGQSSPAPPKAPLSLGYRQDWAGMDAQPFLYPALKQNERKIKEMIKDELQNELRRLGG